VRISHCLPFVPRRFYSIYQTVNGIEYGQGTDATKAGATEIAAQQALVALRGY